MEGRLVQVTDKSGNDLTFFVTKDKAITVSSDRGNPLYLINSGPVQNFSGFWGGVKFLWTGGIIDGYQYNVNGKVIGFAPITGMAPSPGKTFRGGSKLLRDGYITSLPKEFQRWFHRVWKDSSAPNAAKFEIDEAFEIWKSLGKPHPK